MLNKKNVRILSIILLAVVLFVSLGNVAFAYVVPEPDSNVDVAKIEAPIKTALGILQFIGVTVAVFIAMFIGIKYITSSPEGKAEVKKTLAFYIGGIVILLSATGIVEAIKANFIG